MIAKDVPDGDFRLKILDCGRHGAEGIERRERQLAASSPATSSGQAGSRQRSDDRRQTTEDRGQRETCRF